MISIAPDKDWKQLGIYPPLFGLIGYFKFQIGYFKFLYWVSILKQISNETGPALVSPDFFGLLSVSLSETHCQYCFSTPETAIFVLVRKSNVFIKSSMILQTFNAVLKLSYYCTKRYYLIAFAPRFCHCYRKVR